MNSGIHYVELGHAFVSLLGLNWCRILIASGLQGGKTQADRRAPFRITIFLIMKQRNKYAIYGLVALVLIGG